MTLTVPFLIAAIIYVVLVAVNATEYCCPEVNVTAGLKVKEIKCWSERVVPPPAMVEPVACAMGVVVPLLPDLILAVIAPDPDVRTAATLSDDTVMVDPLTVNSSRVWLAPPTACP